MAFHAPAVCHAEVNALLNRNVKTVKGCALYCNYSPCWDCAREMLQAGIVKVVYGELFKQDPRPLDHIKEVTGPDGRLASYPGLLAPAFVACSTNAGEGLVKLSHVV